jgi:hypothetical protein
MWLARLIFNLVMAANIVALVALVTARGCAAKRVYTLDHFNILPAAAGSFACRTTTLISSRSMVGVEASSFATTDPTDAERYLRVYATSSRWQHTSDSTDAAKPFAGWFASPPIDGLAWLEPIGVRSEDVLTARRSITRHTLRFGFSWWILFITFSILPLGRFTAFAMRLRRRRARRRDSRCLACGYDLRATPDRCPECGTAAAQADAAHLTNPLS